MKSLIIHVTSGGHERLKKMLHLNELFKRHYDGWEGTLQHGKMISYRFYFYSITHADLTKMVKFLNNECKAFKYLIKIGANNEGNHCFPEPQ